jgi:hypothetical protein
LIIWTNVIQYTTGTNVRFKGGNLLEKWRSVIGENWDVGALRGYLDKERWDTFVNQNKYLILHAIVNFKNSREKLGDILDNMVKERV